ncbi:MAG TPA: Gfo/Idh/MocA family oxidoreductase [Bryobacteraceae bacterium]|jgi:predicted dehydrogenase|nr:Gfo/Idh/MocA family oxidoreductase [Bryobacteraceae bacterium]
MNRRDLFRTAGSAVISAASYSRVLGANDAVKLGVIGCGNRGLYLMQVFARMPGVRISAVCDVFGQKTARARNAAPGSLMFSDHRALLERGGVDAVLVTTPDHWHAAVSVDAMLAGKDVYVEKPLSFRLEEGARIIETARQMNRICQVGMQQRSGALFLKAKREIIDAKLLGRISLVRTVWHLGEPYDLGPADEPKPADLDWDRFLGPVPWRPWNPHQYHHYRLYLDFGGGCLTDLFTHWIDVVHMFMGQDAPKAVAAGGGIYIAHDDRSAPDTVNVIAQYDGFNVTYESTALPGMPEEHIVFHGSEGTLTINRKAYEFRAKNERAPAIEYRSPGPLDEDHVRNFVECCRSRKAPNCTAYHGDRAARVSLFAKMSYVLNRKIKLDPTGGIEQV